MKKILLLILGFSLSIAMMAQTAGLQIIHNSPSPTVDIYVDGEKVLEEVQFRTATEFLEIPSGIDLQIDIAASPSTDVSESVFSETINLADGVNYVAVAQGVIGDMDRPFGLNVIADALTSSPDTSTVALNVLHGGQDAPNVDVTPRGADMPLIADLGFGESTGYLQLPEDKYLLDILVAGTQDVAASYVADLNGLAGNAGVVLASGYLDPSLGDAFGLFLALPNGGDLVELPTEQFANVQIIHNSPEPTVDIYLNGNKAIEGFEFRTATEYLEMTAGFDMEIGIAPSPSTDTSDIIFRQIVNLEEDVNYAVVAQGVVGDMDRPFQLTILDGVLTESNDPELFAYTLLHGGIDAPAIDAGFLGAPGLLTEGLNFGENTETNFERLGSFILNVFPAGDDTPVKAFQISPEGTGGLGGVLFLSGYLDETAGPDLRLYLALPDGTIIEWEPIDYSLVQIIHNAPSEALDIYIDDQLPLDDFAYTGATNTALLMAGVDYKFDIALANSTSSADAVLTETVNLESFSHNIIFVEGIIGDMDTPLRLTATDNARLTPSNPDQADLLVHHGSPDAPAVDLGERNGDLVLTDLAYGETAEDYITLDARNYFLSLYPTGSAEDFKTFGVNLEGSEGLVGTVFASGLANSTEEVDEFRLMLTLPNGQTFRLPEVGFANVQILHNSPDEAVDVFVGGNKVFESFGFRGATPPIEFFADTDIEIAVAPEGGTIDDAILTRTVNFENKSQNLLVAEGIPGSVLAPFNLFLIDDYRFESEDPAEVDILVLHGSPDAPSVDVLADGNLLVDNITYGSTDGYFSVPPATYRLDVTPADDNANTLAAYRAELESAAGVAVTVFASGLLESMPDFGLWALLPNGTTFPLPLITSTVERVEDNIDLRVGPNPATNYGMIHFSKAMDVERIDLVNPQGQILRNYQNSQLQAYSGAYKFDLNGVPTGTYVLRIMAEGNTYVSKLSVVK